MQLIKFNVTNWRKYNPRHDRKNFTWFRFSNSYFIDPYIFSLSLESKLFLVYLFSEGSKSGDGSGELNTALAASMLKISEQRMDICIQELEIASLASFDRQEPFKKSLTCSQLHSTDRQTDRQTDSVSEVIKSESGEKAAPKNRRGVDDIISQVVDHLNKITGKKFSINAKHTKTVIKARLNEKYCLDDFKKVVNVKASQWLKDGERRKFLRPETLFSAKHFDSYLNEHGDSELDESHDPLYKFFKENSEEDTHETIDR